MGRELDNIDLTSAQRKEVTTLLSRYIPDAEVWAYGSRVKFSAKPNSDLDLVVFISPKQNRAVYQLKEAFEESSLPFRVDLFVWDDVPAQFHKNIEKERVVLQRKKELENVPNGWQNVRLGDVFLVNPPRSITRGTTTPFVPMDILPTNARVFLVDGEREFKGSGQRFQNGDTLLARITPCLENGKTAYVDGLKSGQIAHGSTKYIVLSSKDGISDGLFAYYLARTPKFRTYAIGRIEGTSGRQRVPASSVSEYELDIPPLAEQKAIASVLGALDDKIENNRRMNKTLEEMARAVFKSWFVDFDPVHAKAALQNHSPLEGESANQRQSPQMSRWGGIKRQYTSKAQQRAQTLRKNPTDAEGLLWHYLRKKQLAGRKFRRQQPIGNYIVDFVCMSEQLVIELDGSQHAKQKSYDANRDQFIQDSGYRVLRYWNNQVLSDCYAVLEDIYNHLCPPPHQSSPNGSTSATPPPGGSDNHPPLDIEPMAHPLDAPPWGSDNHPPLDIEPMAHPLDAPPGGSDNHPPLDIEPMAHPLDAPPGGSDNHPPLDIEPMAHPLDTPPGGSDNHPPLDIEPMAHPLDAPPGGSDNHPPLDIEPMAHPLDTPPGGSDNHPPLDIEPMAHPLDTPPGGSDNHPPLDIEPMAHPLDAPPGGSDNHPPLEGGSNSATPNLGRGNWTLERAKRYLAHINTATAALFPSTFGEDGLPKGWGAKPLDSIADFFNGAALQKFPAKDGESLPVIKIAELRNGISANTNRASTKVPEKYVIFDGDVLFSWSGSLMQKVWTEGKGALNQYLFKVTSENYEMWFFYYWVDHHIKWFQSIAASKATTMGHIQRKHLTEAQVVVPDNKVMQHTSKLIGPLLEKQMQNSLENQTLAELRDTLLPKLMSGEVRIKDAEREVEVIA